MDKEPINNFDLLLQKNHSEDRNHKIYHHLVTNQVPITHTDDVNAILPTRLDDQTNKSYLEQRMGSAEKARTLINDLKAIYTATHRL